MRRTGHSPKFEHRHYVAIAALLADALKRECSDLDKVEVVERITRDFSAMFSRDNGNYVASRFLAAAKGTPSTGRDRA